jgi:polar amino acid transport system substrate-binding protein
MKSKHLPRNNSSWIFLASILLALLLIQCKKDKLPVNGDPEKFTYFTEEYAPWNYSENGLLQGVSVDLLEGIFTRLGLPLDRSVIEISDWVPAYEATLKEPNHMLFTTAKTPERKDLFKWVGPIAPHTEIVFALAGSGNKINELTDLNNFFTGVVADYPSLDLLMDKGILRANLVIYDNLNELYEALVVNREVQFMATSVANHNLLIQALGYTSQDFGTPYTFYSTELYYAFNIETADAMIADFQNQLNLLKSEKAADGSSEYEKIMNRYTIIQHDEDGISEEMAINLVNRTAADLESDAPGTLSKINQGLAPYKDPSNPALYSFVYNTDVVMMAHATNASLVGVSFAGKPDAAGKKFRDEIVAGALQHGTGWEDYIYTKPNQSGLYHKTTYYKLATGSDAKQYVVCAGRFK